MFKRLVRHFKRWNKWRKCCGNGRLYKISVLFGNPSPTFGLVLTDEEEEEIHKAVMKAIEEQEAAIKQAFIRGMKGEMMSELKFDWRWKDYGLRATPKGLVRFDEDAPNETIDFLKYYKYGDKERCYSIGYFYYNEHEPCWVLKFVGDRFKEIAPEDLPVVWKYLLAAYDVLTEWKCSEQDI